VARITKNLFFTTMACPTYGWLLQSGLPRQPLSPAGELRIEEGIEIHRRARNLFPDGVLVSGDNETSAQTTQQLISDPNTTAIFEATFIHKNFVAKADILLRDNSSWIVIEVKSNVNDKQELVDDLAYTAFVSQSAGLSISTCSLFLIDKNYRLGMPDKNLFVEIDHSAEVLERAGEFSELFPVRRSGTV
jgi:hypothetical protein